MQDQQYDGVRVVDVAGLGYDATFVRLKTETLLLVEMSLSREERMTVLTNAIGQACA